MIPSATSSKSPVPRYMYVFPPTHALLLPDLEAAKVSAADLAKLYTADTDLEIARIEADT
jgi:hypothetical protein